jgi:hypothetical protein
MQGRTGGCLPRGLLHGLGDVARHIPGPFVTPMLRYQEGVVILLEDGPQLGRKAKTLCVAKHESVLYSRMARRTSTASPMQDA